MIRILFAPIVISGFFCSPLMAAKVYVYQGATGESVITDHQLDQREFNPQKYRLVKSYTPQDKVRTIRQASPDFRAAKIHKHQSSRTMQSQAYDRLIFKAADDARLDRALVKAIVHVESSFNPDAVSGSGALGLMQLMPATAEHYRIHDPFDAESNLVGGTRYLKDLMSRYNNDLHLALAAYNAGETIIDKYQGMPPFAETRAYVKKVLNLHRQYQRQARDIYG